ncbi:phosphatase [Anaerolentibacter hominis]|uniref:phosphatase n=1 Tax=Anaerolentibacter hominis TaxID=3079009 RepID=UPI0031B816D5
MEFVLDTHTHSLVSGHAYSTLKEMIDTAREKDLKLLAVTEHGPAIKGTTSEMYYYNLKVVPRRYGDLELMLGTEANIIDFTGGLDIGAKTIRCVDYIVASMHMYAIAPGTYEENTAAYLGALRNPGVNTIGHPDDGRYPFDMEALVKGAKETGTLLELNNSSLMPKCSRLNAWENDKAMLLLCKEMSVPIVVDSDAHICYDVGNFTQARKLLEEVNFPEKLVANTSVEKFKELLAAKKGR